MISGIHKNFMPFGTPGRSNKPEKALGPAINAESSSAPSFAEKLEGVDHTVRRDTPGREDRSSNTDREGERATERDSIPQPKKALTRAENNLESKSVRAKAKRDEPEPLKRDSEPSAQAYQQSSQTAQSVVPERVRFDGEGPESSEDSEAEGISASGEPSDGKPVDVTKSKLAPSHASQGSSDGTAAAAGTAATLPKSLKPSDPSEDQTLSALDTMRDEQAQARKSALTDFMSRMQAEFGVPPEKIVEAFSNMDEKTLMAPPEESTKEFLANLPLKPEQQVRAAALYKDMVRTTGEAALNEKIIGLESGVNFEVESPRDTSLRNLNQSIDDLNSSFAMHFNQAKPGSEAFNGQMRAQLAAEQMNAQLAARLAQQNDGTQLDTKNRKAGDSAELIAATALAGGGAGTLGTGVTDASVGATSSGGAAAGMPTTSMMSMPGGMGFGAQNGGMGAAGGESFAGGGSSLGGGSASAAGTSEVATKSSFASSMAAAESKAASGAGGKKASAEAKGAAGTTAGNAGDSQVAADAANSGMQPAAVTSKAGTGPAGMISQRPTVTAQDEQLNIKELIHQAQLSVKKGGGEIKMDLKPEGIGQVRLKVSVQDGQVSIQMLTQNDEAKRMLEKGLHELKSNLAAHELKVDNLKVDVGQELQKHMDKQQSDDQARQSTRQFANDVMSQFRDERNAFQQGFMENSGWKQYARQDRRKPMDSDSTAPSVSAAPAQIKSRARSANEGRLDLVA